MSDKRIYITEATNGWYMEFCRFDEDHQKWIAMPGTMVFQDLDVMMDKVREEFGVRRESGE